jgi:hypothetical protein
MRTRIDHVQVFHARVSAVRDWKTTKKVAMNRANVKRCARDLKISSCAVRDAMNATKIRYSF